MKLKKGYELKNIALKIGITIVGVVTLVLLGSFASRIFIHKHVDSDLDASIDPETPAEGIQISILNSTSIPGIADQARDYMRDRGFDVVEIGNYGKPQSKTCVFDRVGDFGSALKVAKAMGVADSLVFTKKDSTLFLRATVVLGNDYKYLRSFR